MTTPNHLTPEGSITNEGSWSEVQARTEEEWKAGEYAKWSDSMSGIPKIGDQLAEIPVIGGALSDFFEVITGIPDSDPNDVGSLILGFMNQVDGTSADLGEVIKNMYNGWFGSGSVKDPIEVQYTIQAIKDAIQNGYNVWTQTSSGTRTLPPDLNEAYAILVGGGENGSPGTYQTSGVRTPGGRGGGFVCTPLDAATVSGQTLTLTVASPGNISTVKLGTTTLATCGPGSAGGIASGIFGYAPTTSTPGNGGEGGWGYNQLTGNSSWGSGLAGGGSAAAFGGAGGTTAGADGYPGGNANPAATTKSAGGGGGGGAGGIAAGGGGDGGNGGPGGYPGGGGGSGGCRGTSSVGTSGSNGAAGVGAAGIIWLVFR